jgi:hypothetical protein
MVSFWYRPLYSQGKSPWYTLDAVVKRKIPNPRRESNPRTPIIHPVAQLYTE